MQTTLINNSDIGNEIVLLNALQIEDPIQSIKYYLEALSEKDTQLKNGINNPRKNFDGCWEYIQSRAKKHLNSRSGHVPPLTIFGWAIHYFVESEKLLNDELGKTTSTTKTVKPIKRPVETAEERLKRMNEKFASLV